MIEIKLDGQERAICREVTSCALALFSHSQTFKNRERWERLFALVAEEGVVCFEAEQLRLLISGFNVYNLLTAGETEKLSKYLRGSLHESENLEVFFESVRTEMCAAYEAPERYAALKRKLSAALKDFTSARRFLPRKLYISDLHFCHANLNHQMDMRGFADEEELHAYMIGQWQAHVHEKDEVYILGDFCMGRGGSANEILRQLPGKKYLIIGNHDRFLEDKAFDATLFRWTKPYAEVKDHHRTVILSHYPIFCYNGQYRLNPDGTPKAYMLYGHVHNTPDEALVNAFIRQTRAAKHMSRYAAEPQPVPCNMINCFCMFSDYIPLTLDEWIAADEKRRKEMEDVSDNPV